MYNTLSKKLTYMVYNLKKKHISDEDILSLFHYFQPYQTTESFYNDYSTIRQTQIIKCLLDTTTMCRTSALIVLEYVSITCEEQMPLKHIYDTLLNTANVFRDTRCLFGILHTMISQYLNCNIISVSYLHHPDCRIVQIDADYTGKTSWKLCPKTIKAILIPPDEYKKNKIVLFKHRWGHVDNVR